MIKLDLRSYLSFLSSHAFVYFCRGFIEMKYALTIGIFYSDWFLEVLFMSNPNIVPHINVATIRRLSFQTCSLLVSIDYQNVE